MLNYFITGLIAVIAVVGSFFPKNTAQIWDDVKQFGSTNFPTSLDTLTNPASTDSVATVSHSSQHANANDAIEAIEAKIGISTSTAVVNSILAGNGAGSSIWTTYGTTTNFRITSLGLFNSFISQASSTIVGGLTITGNSTTTNATSTISAVTGYATSTSYWGAGLQSCSAGQVLLWTNGQYSCTSAGTSAIPDISIATSSNTDYLASTTAMTSGQKIVWHMDCSRGANNNVITTRYKLNNEIASTTMLVSGSNTLSGTGLFVATTSVTITVEMVATGCDQGASLTTTLYK